VLSFLSEAQEHQAVNRRDFTALLGGAAAAWPLAAGAQQPAKLPTIGYLGPSTLSAMSQWTASFVQRLRELGWVECRYVAFEYRWAEGRAERHQTGKSGRGRRTNSNIFRQILVRVIDNGRVINIHSVRIRTSPAPTSDRVAVCCSSGWGQSRLHFGFRGCIPNRALVFHPDMVVKA
jgi:hypothetical protein